MKIESVLVHAFVGGKSSLKVELPIGRKFMCLHMRNEGIYAYHLVPEMQVPFETVEFFVANSNSSINIDESTYLDSLEYIHQETNQMIVFHIFQNKN